MSHSFSTVTIGTSLWPLVQSNSIISFSEVHRGDLKLGDLVVYKNGSTQICHRMIGFEKDRDLFLLKADTSVIPDGWIPFSNIIGRVTHINEKSIDRFSFRLISYFAFIHSRIQYELFRGLFCSSLGKWLFKIRTKIFGSPIFLKAFHLMSSPWLIVLGWNKNSIYLWLKRQQKYIGRGVFQYLVTPQTFKCVIRKYNADYGHGFQYEKIFCRDLTDVDDIEILLRGETGKILDLGGGAGRLSLRLSSRGHPVVLMDRSESMLKEALQAREKLPDGAKKCFRLIQADLKNFSIDEKFKWIISLQNGFEHLGSEDEVLDSLLRVKAHLFRDGVCFLDLHHLSYWEGLSHWKKTKWNYILDRKFDGKRYRIWEKTAHLRDNLVVWEHALLSRVRWTRLSTTLQILPVEKWKSLLDQAGFIVLGTWSNFKRDPLDSLSPKTIFCLTHKEEFGA